ncbi:hypothetical protein EMCRGX_G024551 [Ephydatia muelleri]
MHTLVINRISVMVEMDDVQVKRAIQSAGERMGHAKVKDEQFRVIEDVSPPDADDSEEDESEVDDEWSLTQGSDNEDGVEDSEDEVVDSHEID